MQATLFSFPGFRKWLNPLLPFIILALSINHSSAQTISEKRSKLFNIKADTLQIDTSSIVPGSLILENKKTGAIISPSAYKINEATARLQWIKKPTTDTVQVSYRALPINISKVDSHKDFGHYNKRDSLYHSLFTYTPMAESTDIFDLGNMNYNGSFARGISFGNNQDVVVNSNFNMQMAGKLAGDVEVTAAISDNNIPIQPQGNTQQIQDFDKIYIQLKKNRTQLTVGDLELSRPVESYFMNFYKKLQGGSLSTSYKLNDSGIGSSKVTIAVAKGKYTTNNFTGSEGNQGPYRLTGANGESVIIILAGTESVYIDGIKMNRGDDNDYVIDYNAGTVTFTAKRLITVESRISIEFEYSDQNYFRTVLYGQEQLKWKKLQISFNAYSEQDDKNQPLQQTLDSSQEKLLYQVGDSLQKAYTPSIDSIAFDATRILYKKVDSTKKYGVNGIIYIYSTSPDSAHWALNFSLVSQGKGDYVLATSSANGRVYRWVPPVNGIHQGNYAPIIPLIAPTRQQMFTLGGVYSYSKTGKVSIEGALSNYDANTFSPYDDGNNVDVASHINLSQDVILSSEKGNQSKLNFTADYEYTGAHFKAIDRYRPVEFERDWNLANTDSNATENLGNFSATYTKEKLGTVTYLFSTYSREGDYFGTKNTALGNLTLKGFTTVFNVSDLNSTSTFQNTNFLRPNIDFSKMFKKLKKWKLGANYQGEHNVLNDPKGDSLLRASYYWNQYGGYISSGDTGKFKFKASYTERFDYGALQHAFGQSTQANTASVSGEWVPKAASQLTWNITYRELFVKDTFLTTQRYDQSLLGRTTYNFVFKKGFVTSQTLYELGSGQEQKTQFAYVQVPAGQGVYTYAGDFNHNGVQDLNEFEIAPFADLADYIRVYTPTDVYIKDYSTLFNESFSINPKVLWSKATKGLKAFLNRLNSQTTLQINRKTLQSDFNSQFNPFDLKVKDTVLVSLTANVSQYIYFNRTNPIYGVDLGYQSNVTKSALVDGPESQSLNDYSARIRWNVTKKFSTINKIDRIQKINSSEYFSNQNYNIYTSKWEPQLIYQPNNKFRTALTYDYINSKNIISETGEKSLQNQGSIEAKYTIVSKSTLSVKFTYAGVDYSGGTATSPSEYAMLDGLEPGVNLLWNVTVEKKLSGKINLSLSYDGRKTGTTPLVNVGRAQLQALF